jgi:hypothetical protein
MARRVDPRQGRKDSEGPGEPASDVLCYVRFSGQTARIRPGDVLAVRGAQRSLLFEVPHVLITQEEYAKHSANRPATEAPFTGPIVTVAPLQVTRPVPVDFRPMRVTKKE